MEFAEESKAIASEVAKKAKKEHKLSVFTIASTRNMQNRGLFFPPVRVTQQAVCGNVMLFKLDEAEQIAKAVDGIVDIILVDAEQKMAALKGLVPSLSKKITKSKMLTFKTNDFTADAADNFLSQLVGDITDKKVAIIGSGNLGSKIGLKLAERGTMVVLTRRDKKSLKTIVDYINLMTAGQKTGNRMAVGTTDNVEAAKDSDIILGATAGEPVITPEVVNAMKKDGIIVDCGIGTIKPDAIELGRQKGIKMFRLDMRAGFAGALTSVLETDCLLNEVMGRRKEGRHYVVAGGVIGNKGDMVVDNISKPTYIIGEADGRGSVIRRGDKSNNKMIKKQK